MPEIINGQPSAGDVQEHMTLDEALTALNTAHRTTDEAATALNTTHRGSNGSSHSKVGANETAAGLNTTHRSSDGSNHSKVVSAIHKDVDAEISTVAEKASPISADLVIIEDSAASNAKKKVQVGNLPAGATTFPALTDTPANYTGSAGKYPKVNVGENGLEFDQPTPGSAFTSKCSVYRNGAQVIADVTWTKVQLDTEDYDIDGEHDKDTNHRFQPDVTGYYHVNICVEVEALGDTKTVNVGIYKNGTLWKCAISSTGTTITATLRVPISCDMYLLNTDYIEVYVRHTHGSNRNIGTNGRFTFMDVHRFG